MVDHLILMNGGHRFSPSDETMIEFLLRGDGAARKELSIRFAASMSLTISS
jgi:hypothetical protein